MRAIPLADAVWPSSQLAEAVCALLRGCGIASAKAAEPLKNPGTSPVAPTELVEWQAKVSDCMADPVEMTLGHIESRLPRLCPVLLALHSGGYLPVLKVQKGEAAVLTPESQIRTIPFSEICTALLQTAREAALPAASQMVEAAGLANRSHLLESLLRQNIAGQACRVGWSFRPQPRPGIRGLLRDSGAGRNAALLFAAHFLQYLLWLASWFILGRLSLRGQMDQGWLIAWALLLFTLIPLRVFSTYAQGVLAIAVGAVLKRHLLLGAMRLHPQEVKGQGIGSILSQVFESEAFENLALSGGIAGVLAAMELVVAAFVLGSLSLLLLCVLIATGLLVWRFGKAYRNWTSTRMQLSGNLIESMVGHRTRVAQQGAGEWHRDEDVQLDTYLDRSQRIDRYGAWLISAVPRGWLLAALVALAPSALSGLESSSTVALRLGGVLLAFSALQRLMGAAVDIVGTCVAAERIGPLFKAGGRREIVGQIPPQPTSSSRSNLVEVERVTFAYESTSKLALQPVNLSIRQGERLLLEGPSGGGKSTLSALISGLRRPSSGLILAGGLDRFTLGEQGWRKRVATAPQFHDNYIFSETLAFNLLLGRPWPPYRADLEAAENICRRLGLGDLLDRMPSGLMQMVGESGWQLSHGERSRIFLARALLQNADLTILDESFGALDPDTMKTALEHTLANTNALLVHP